MMDGRVKTLHPKVHGGLLARRDLESHMAQAAEHGIELIDMVVVNLYAFEATIAKEGVTEAEAIENIDIGGPSMLRSAAKNFSAVTVVTKPADLRRDPRRDARERRRHHTRDAQGARDRGLSHHQPLRQRNLEVPLGIQLHAVSRGGPAAARKVQDLRYGENPHQAAAFYRFDDAKEHTLGLAEQLQGKELSYNNILDTDACWAAVREFDQPACVIVKHTNPCGVAVNEDLTTAYKRAHDADSISAYGGVMAFNRAVPGSLIQAIFDNGQFVEVMIAPDYEPQALELLATKKNLRVLRTGGVRPTGRALRVPRCRGRHAGSDERFGRRGPCRVHHRHPSASHARGDGPASLRVEGRQEREEQRHSSGEELRDGGRGRRPDEPCGQRTHRHREGGGACAEARCARRTRSCRSPTRSRSVRQRASPR